jgi:ABC-type Fe3+/spermidine/putrescine transport system ATPase subunit
VRIAIRPEWLDLFRPAPGEVPPGENALPARVQEVIYLGETMHVLASLADETPIRVALRNEGQLSKPLPWQSGQEVLIGWLPEDCQVLEEA